jgi:hypothetical protein
MVAFRPWIKAGKARWDKQLDRFCHARIGPSGAVIAFVPERGFAVAVGGYPSSGPGVTRTAFHGLTSHNSRFDAAHLVPVTPAK